MLSLTLWLKIRKSNTVGKTQTLEPEDLQDMGSDERQETDIERLWLTTVIQTRSGLRAGHHMI